MRENRGSKKNRVYTLQSKSSTVSTALSEHDNLLRNCNLPVRLSFYMQRTKNVQNVECCSLIEWDLHMGATAVFGCDTISV
jgi:hypothetical protein